MQLKQTQKSKGKTHDSGKNINQNIVQVIHDTGGSSFFLNKKGSFERKCVICDEKHDEHFHNPEFATENIDDDEKCSEVLKTPVKDSVKKKDSIGETLFYFTILFYCLILL